MIKRQTVYDIFIDGEYVRTFEHEWQVESYKNILAERGWDVSGITTEQEDRICGIGSKWVCYSAK